MSIWDFFKRVTGVTGVAASGSQRAYDLEAIQNLNPLFGIRAPEKLTDYRNYYLSNFLARRVVDALTQLVVSPICSESENPELDKRVQEFIRATGLIDVIRRAVRQMFAYGFSGTEIVFDRYPDPNEVLKFHVVDSRSLRVNLDPSGTPVEYIQLPAALGYTEGGKPISIPPETILWLSDSPLGDSVYGSSILLAIEQQIRASATLLSAMQKSAVRATLGQELFAYQAAEGESSEEAETAVSALVTQYDQAEPGQPLFVGAAGEFKRQSPSQNNPSPLQKELEATIIAAISGSGLTPAAIGYATAASLHQAYEQRLVLVSFVTGVQNQLVTQLNTKVFQVLADIWNTPEISVRMEPPILESIKERAETETIQINNVGLKSKMGIVTGDNVAQELGYDTLGDPEQFKSWLENGETPEQSRNPNDRNTTQQDSKALRNDNADE